MMDMTSISNSTSALTASDGTPSVRTYVAIGLGILTLAPVVFVLGFATILKLMGNKVDPKYD
jgi:4-amino-4-deoxy-L-arabinose transferase-like glycosyltransferase